MRMIVQRLALVLVVGLSLGACGLFDDELSPRERALNLYALFEPAQIVAETAVTSPLLADNEGAKNAIKTAELTARTLVTEYDDLTRGCLRDPQTGEIILAQDPNRPNLVCSPDAALALLPSASAALGTLTTELTRHGFIVGGPT